jgi:prolyl-tRNA synthetase
LGDNEKVVTAAGELYEHLKDAGIDVLYDDRDVRPGEKFADADLLGIPYRVVVSAKTVEQGTFECKARNKEETQMLDLEGVIKMIVTPEESLV